MYQGGCLCGNLRYRADAPAIWPHLCSCEHCQRLGGTPVMAWVGFPADILIWTGPGGEPTWYETYPRIARGFCSICGSTVAAKGDAPESVGVTMMSLDDHSDLTPLHQSFADNAVAWLPPIETVDDGG
ncbi:GFA family protein [Nocardia sp. NEAU-351]|uniref:GFA family protein n=1 Tax=Nocardia bovistercoris TaxID=2785916 RepID=A0A931IIV8_9NOCA|nr:GFA family protein [Nocardia bovistercoris]